MKKYIIQIKKYVFAQLFFAFMFTVCMALLPVLQKVLFDDIERLTIRFLIMISVGYLFLHAGASLFEYLSMVFTWKGAIVFEKSMKRDFFFSVFHMRQEVFLQRPVGEYISLQANDVTALEQDWLQPVVDLIRSGLMILTYAVTIVIFINWRIALTMLCVSCLSVVVSSCAGKKLQGKRDVYQKIIAEYTSAITDLLEGFGLINSRTVDSVSRRHEEKLAEASDSRLRFGVSKSRSLAINDFSLRIIRVVAFVAAGLFYFWGKVTLGTAVASFGYVTSFVEPIDSILYDVTTLKSVEGVKRKFLELTGRHTKAMHTVPNKAPVIELKNVSAEVGDFKLEKINHVFSPGKKYAIIGSNGSGKSILLKLLTGQLTPTQGEVLVGNDNISEVDTSNIISRIDQAEHVFMDGFFENATMWGSYNAGLLKEKMELFPAVYLEALLNYHADDNSQLMSGGEKQLLFFLRSLIRDCPVIVMDEPFSAMNPDMAGKCEEILFSEEMCDRLVVMVTHNHRKEFLSRFDQVIDMG